MSTCSAVMSSSTVGSAGEGHRCMVDPTTDRDAPAGSDDDRGQPPVSGTRRCVGFEHLGHTTQRLRVGVVVVALVVPVERFGAERFRPAP